MIGGKKMSCERSTGKDERHKSFAGQARRTGAGQPGLFQKDPREQLYGTREKACAQGQDRSLGKGKCREKIGLPKGTGRKGGEKEKNNQNQRAQGWNLRATRKPTTVRSGRDRYVEKD